MPICALKNECPFFMSNFSLFHGLSGCMGGDSGGFFTLINISISPFYSQFSLDLLRESLGCKWIYIGHLIMLNRADLTVLTFSRENVENDLLLRF